MKKRYFIIFIIIICSIYLLYSLSNSIIPRMENTAEKELKSFLQIIINHATFSKKINNAKLYDIIKNENEIRSISFNMDYINDIASDYVNNVEEILFSIEEGNYKPDNNDLYNKKLKKISDQKGVIASVSLGNLTNNIFFQNSGPKLYIKYKTLSITNSNIKKSIKSYGINHIAISIELDISITLQMMIPFYSKNQNDCFSIPVIYEIIQGDVPSWYQS